MGGDSSPILLFDAVLQAAQSLGAQITWVVFATQSIVDEISQSASSSLISSIEFHIAQEVITMDDEPIGAIRRKKNSSLVIGMRLLRKKGLDAFVSAANTGALIAYATLFLPHIAEIKRPALLAVLPTLKGSVAVVDVGGNVSSKSHHLVQFAQMGAAYIRCCHGIPIPTIGLLNIGVESKKGTSNVKLAYQALQELVYPKSLFHFIGNIEGREVFQGKVDVLVTDGFSGNIFLKTSEGVSSFIIDLLKQNLSVHSEALSSAAKMLNQRLNYEESQGAILCGIDRLVIKCHGSTSTNGMYNALVGAVSLVKNQFITQFKEQLSLGLTNSVD